MSIGYKWVILTVFLNDNAFKIIYTHIIRKEQFKNYLHLYNNSRKTGTWSGDNYKQILSFTCYHKGQLVYEFSDGNCVTWSFIILRLLMAVICKCMLFLHKNNWVKHKKYVHIKSVILSWSNKQYYDS